MHAHKSEPMGHFIQFNSQGNKPDRKKKRLQTENCVYQQKSLPDGIIRHTSIVPVLIPQMPVALFG